jgi:hypothetical protein
MERGYSSNPISWPETASKAHTRSKESEQFEAICGEYSIKDKLDHIISDNAVAPFSPHYLCGPFQFVSDVYAEELEAFHLLCCGPINVDKGVLPLLFPDIHDQLVCFVDVE